MTQLSFYKPTEEKTKIKPGSIVFWKGETPPVPHVGGRPMSMKKCAGCNALTINKNHQCPRPNGNGSIIVDHCCAVGVSDYLGYLYCTDCVTQDRINEVNNGKAYAAWSWEADDICDCCGRSVGRPRSP